MQEGEVAAKAAAAAAAGDLSAPAREPDAEMQAQLRYYSPGIHRAAFVLPEFVRRKLVI